MNAPPTSCQDGEVEAPFAPEVLRTMAPARIPRYIPFVLANEGEGYERFSSHGKRNA